MAKRGSNPDENINHLGLVRMRVRGYGNLIITAYSYNFVDSEVLPTIAMELNTAKQPTVLANFKSQKMQLEIRTSEINEVFNITRVIPYIKPVESSFPE